MFEVTKRKKLLEVNNEMCHNYYYLINGRLWNEDKTRFYKLKFVEWFDVFDVQEYFDKECYTQEDINEYLNECIFGSSNWFEFDRIDNAVEWCNCTIKWWNGKQNEIS